MKIVVDDKIPYIEGVLEKFGEVVYLPGKLTTSEVVKDADAIITRTRTICNKDLLDGSSVKMIATATIGYDHIDTEYCANNNIEWTNAPGCNSWSVAQYIMAALHQYSKTDKIDLYSKTIGIIGVGNVGSKVAQLCKALNMNVLLYDPPREELEGPSEFSTLQEIQDEADIITFHTPLSYNQEHETYHLADDNFFENCVNEIVFINSSRGEVMDTAAVKRAILTGKIKTAIIDCWENEPNIDLNLLQKAFITTPHIAGYSKDGKANGTSMSVQSISKKFNLMIDDWECENIEKPQNTHINLNGRGKTKQEIITEAILTTYPIEEDSKKLKEDYSTFEKQRGEYPVRREFPTFTLNTSNITDDTICILEMLGFAIEK